jgi:hypothetical protein
MPDGRHNCNCGGDCHKCLLWHIIDQNNEILVALEVNPSKLQELADKLNKKTAAVKAAVDANPIPLGHQPHSSTKEFSMNPMDAITKAVNDASAGDDSIIALCTGLSAYIAAHKTDPAALQALADSLNSKTAAVVAAIAANPIPATAKK